MYKKRKSIDTGADVQRIPYRFNSLNKDLDLKIIRDMMTDVITSIYRWDDLPPSIRPEYIELYLAVYGQCAICPGPDGEPIVAMVERGGDPDVYGLGSTPIISTRNGYTEQYDEVVDDVAYGEEGHRAVIIYNNNTKTPAAVVGIFANLLTEAVISFYQNIIHSRYIPVFVAATDIIKSAVETKMEDIIAGEPVVIVSDNIVREIESGLKTLDTVNMTDVDKQEKIQFITKTIDDIFRWFLSIYGQAVQGNGKLAQQTVDEVNGATSASFIIPESGLRCRNKAVELINSTFGYSCSVSYNKPWAVELEKYTEDVEETAEEPSEPEEEPEKEDNENEESMA